MVELNRYIIDERAIYELASLDKGQEFFPSLLLCSETSEHAGSDRHRARLLNAPHGHTQVTANVMINKYPSEPVAQTYVASITTATPRGLIASCTAIAICLVRRS